MGMPIKTVFAASREDLEKAKADLVSQGYAITRVESYTQDGVPGFRVFGKDPSGQQVSRPGMKLIAIAGLLAVLSQTPANAETTFEVVKHPVTDAITHTLTAPFRAIGNGFKAIHGPATAASNAVAPYSGLIGFVSGVAGVCSSVSLIAGKR